MVRCWYTPNEVEDQRKPNFCKEGEFLDASVLNRIGVEAFKFNPDSYEADLQKVSDEREYNYKDTITVNEQMENYEAKLKSFFAEHIHSDEEIRYVIDGSGYFDVRDANDDWVRIEITPGDLLIVPAGIYHRFTLDEKNFIKVHRLFQGEPVWTPLNRPQEDHPIRQEYVKKFVKA